MGNKTMGELWDDGIPLHSPVWLRPAMTTACLSCARMRTKRHTCKVHCYYHKKKSKIKYLAKRRLTVQLFLWIKETEELLCFCGSEWIGNTQLLMLRSAETQCSQTLHNRPKYFYSNTHTHTRTYTHTHMQSCFYPHYSHCSNGVRES